MHPCQFLRRKAASEYLAATWGIPCSPSTLAKLAVIGGGPTFRRAGRIPLYSSGDLDTWATSKLSGPMRSTSDADCQDRMMRRDTKMRASRTAVVQRESDPSLND